MPSQDMMNIKLTDLIDYVPYLLFLFFGLALLLLRNRRAKLKCPQCKRVFGKKAADKISPYCKQQMLDGPMFTINGQPGRDGYTIHCDNCDIDVVFDNKNNPMDIG